MDPVIRYITSERGVAQRVVQSVQDAAQAILRNIDFGTFDCEPLRGKKLNLLIVDRLSDCVSPLLTEYTYQAIVHDILPVEHNSIKVKIKDQEKVVMLDESDSFWVEVRHMHLANASPYVVDEFNAFVASHKGMASGKAAGDMKQMGEMMKALPEYMDLMTKFSIHMTLIPMCFAKMEELNLNSIASVEQILATGVDNDGKPVKNTLSWVSPVVGNQLTAMNYKLRMLALYFLTQERKDSDFKKLTDMVRFADGERAPVDAANKLPQTVREKPPKKKKKDKKEDGEEETFELSRYVTLLRETVLRLAKNDVPACTTLHPTTVLSYDHGLKPTQGNITVGGGKSLKKNTTKAADEGGKLATGKKEKVSLVTKMAQDKDVLIIFVTGCISYSEMRVAYELSDKLKMNVFIGSNAIFKPDDFVRALGTLESPELKAFETV